METAAKKLGMGGKLKYVVPANSGADATVTVIQFECTAQLQ